MICVDILNLGSKAIAILNKMENKIKQNTNVNESDRIYSVTNSHILLCLFRRNS